MRWLSCGSLSRFFGALVLEASNTRHKRPRLQHTLVHEEIAVGIHQHGVTGVSLTAGPR